MLIHTCFLLIIASAAYARYHRCFFYAAGLILLLFAALRHGFGNDYFSYYRCFLEISQLNENPFDGEVLYTALNHLMPHYYWLIALTSVVFVCCLCSLIQQGVSRQWMWLSFALLLINPYLFLMHLSAIRQSLALVCFICAVPCAYKRKPICYCLLILAACGFHNSAVILFPVYFVANDRPFSRKAGLLILMITAGLMCLEHYLYHTLSTSLVLLQLMRYNHILLQNTHNSLRATLLSSVTFFYLLWNLPRLQGKTLAYAKVWLIGSAFSVLAFRMSMLTRLEMYFDIFSIVAFPRMLCAPRRGNALAELLNNYAFPAVILLILLLRYYSFFTNPMWESFFTYQTILSA